MTFYFAGGEMGAYLPSDATSDEFAGTFAGNDLFDPSFTRCCLIGGYASSSQYAQSADMALPDEFYTHFDFYPPSASAASADNFIEFCAGSTGLFRLRYSGSSSTIQMQAKISGSFTNIGSPVTFSNAAMQTIDLYIDGNSATGTAELYLSGTLRESAAAVDLSAVTAIDNIKHYGPTGSNGGPAISQVIIADEPTIGMRLMTVYPSGAGASSQFTGPYTGIDEIIYNDADFIYSATNGHISLFTGTAISALTGYVVRAVAVTSRSKRGAAGPANLQHVLRVNGNNYASSSNALGVGYGAFCDIWATNPDTAVDWLVADIATLQFGVKAVT